MRKKVRRRPLRWYVIWVFIFSFLFASLVLFLVNLPVWDIREVEVTGNQYLFRDDLLKLADIPLGDNIFLTRFDKARKTFDKIVQIEKVNFKRRLPHRLEIQIIERKPFAVAIISGNSTIIDRAGYILDSGSIALPLTGKFILPHASIDSSKLPVVSGIDEKELIGGYYIKKEFSQTVFDLFPKLTIFFKQSNLNIQFNGLENVSVLINDITKVRFGPIENMEEKMRVLKYLLEVSRPKANEIEYIDVRLTQNPVIKYR